MYMLISGNRDASLDWSVICQQTSSYKEDINPVPHLGNDFCYLIDGDGDLIQDYKVEAPALSWNTRSHCSDATQAETLIEDRLGCFDAFAYNSEEQIREIETFANEQGVAFNANLYIKLMDNVKDRSEEHWDSSSAHC